ncbi:MAG: PorP/SprF family type IX secretion system membrane protein [Bacteroidetes bacterium]|nr:PorP/SprF family type IX secretion system membrane protein [Bacteroidota bacterium]
MKKVVVILLIILFCKDNVFAQDIHLSQYNASPQNLNPAQTGLFDGDWRLVGNYRSQWSAIPVPYKTFSLSADTRLKTKLKNDVPAAGLLINTDRAGDSRFTTMQVFVSGSYIKKLNSDSTHFVSLAIQPGITTKSFDVAALTFDQQWDGDSYNSSLSSGENFPKTRITYFDMGAGLAYLWRKNNRTKLNFGVSALHLTKPKQSFFNDNNIQLDMKFNVSALAQIPVAAKLDVMPSFLYQNQGKFNETLIGLFGKYHLTPINGQETAVSLGAFYRLKDAFILAANMDYRNFNVGVSYDVNTSKLIEATNRRGGFEISVIYIFKKMVPFVAKKRVCPTDM